MVRVKSGERVKISNVFRVLQLGLSLGRGENSAIFFRLG